MVGRRPMHVLRCLAPTYPCCYYIPSSTLLLYQTCPPLLKLALPFSFNGFSNQEKAHKHAPSNAKGDDNPPHRAAAPENLVLRGALKDTRPHHHISLHQHQKQAARKEAPKRKTI